MSESPAAGRPGPMDADVAAVLAVVQTYFAAFTSGPGADVRLQQLRDVMLPRAIVVRTCGQELAVYDVDSFIAPRRLLLTDGSLTDFHEQATSGHIDVFGDIAHWFGRYTKDGRLHGEPCPGAGMKSIQLIRTPAGWRVTAAAWDDERPGVSENSHRDAELGESHAAV